MNEKLIKKWISIVSIVCISISGILGILYVAEVLKGSIYLGNVFLTLLTFVVAGLLLLNCVSMPKEKEKYYGRKFRVLQDLLLCGKIQ